MNQLSSRSSQYLADKDFSAKKASFLSQVYQNLENANPIKAIKPTAQQIKPESTGGTLGEFKQNHQFKIKMASTSSFHALMSLFKGSLAKPGALDDLLENIEACQDDIEQFIPFGALYNFKFKSYLSRRSADLPELEIKSEGIQRFEAMMAQKKAAEKEAVFRLVQFEDEQEEDAVEEEMISFKAKETPFKLPPGAQTATPFAADDLALQIQKKDMRDHILYRWALDSGPEFAKQTPFTEETVNGRPFLCRIIQGSLDFKTFQPPESGDAREKATLLIKLSQIFDPERQNQGHQHLQKMKANEGLSMSYRAEIFPALADQNPLQPDRNRALEKQVQLQIRLLGQGQIRLLLNQKVIGPPQLPLPLLQNLLGFPVKEPQQRELQKEFVFALQTPAGKMAYGRILRALGTVFTKLPPIQNGPGIKIMTP